MRATYFLSLSILLFFNIIKISAQEDPYIPIDIPSQNLLKFNRFLLNPTFSSVRENKSYLNLYHRNQNIQFDNTFNTYLLSYSGRMGDRSGLGLNLYSQKVGTISNFGVIANYAYGLKLADKASITFGFNTSYYNSGFDPNASNVNITEDPRLAGLQGNSLLSFQPGFNISLGQFDFGGYAENLFDYNLKTGRSLTSFEEKTFSAHLQYTQFFSSISGLFEKGRLLTLARGSKTGQNDVDLSGSLVLDLPKLGWLQGGYHTEFGVSGGIGFNFSRRISLGYSIEKGVNNSNANLGLTHEINFAYSFEPTLTEDRIALEEKNEGNVAKAQNKFKKLEEKIVAAVAEKDGEIKRIKSQLEETNRVIAEVVFRQDSIAKSRNANIERRLDEVLQLVKNKGSQNSNLKQQTKEAKNTYSPRVAYTSNKKKKSFTGKSKSSEVLAFEKEARKNNIKSRRVTNLKGVENGYYIIANVYKGDYYFNKFIKNLSQKGFDVKYFKNPNSGLKYVYLQKFQNWENAISSCKSKLNGTYTDEIWIMNVDNHEPMVATSSINSNILVDNFPKNNFEKSKKNTNFAKVGNKTPKTSHKVFVKRKPVKKVVITTADLDKGYYLVANVFSIQKNADKFVKELKNKGVEADYFINPNNNYKYVYLEKYPLWSDALVSYYSNLNNTYDEDVWIMRVSSDMLPL